MVYTLMRLLQKSDFRRQHRHWIKPGFEILYVTAEYVFTTRR